MVDLIQILTKQNLLAKGKATRREARAARGRGQARTRTLIYCLVKLSDLVSFSVLDIIAAGFAAFNARLRNVQFSSTKPTLT